MKKITISNDFIKSIIIKNNPLTLKILFYCVYFNNIIKENDENIYLSIDLKHLKGLFDLNFKNLRQNLQSIQKTLISLKNENKNIKDINLIKQVDYIYDEQKIIIEISQLIYKELKNIKNYFTVIDLDNLIQLDNKHSIRFITILELLNNYGPNVSKSILYNLKDLNELFGSNYKTFKEIERSILIPIKKELDQYSLLTFIYNFNYDYLKETRGRKPIKNIKIILQENKIRQLKFNF